jgi:Ala-tRNA(Pro) deacylase
MKCKERLDAYLRERQVPFEVQHHPLALTAQQVAASEHLPGRLVAKVVVVSADGRPAMLVLPAPYRVSLPKAEEALAARAVRLLEEPELRRLFPDCEVGAMPPFGNLYGLPVWVDRALAEDEVIVFNAGTHTDTISLMFADFRRLVQPTTAEFALRP